ncbi:MAG: T9SS type A sorting domain-containing protein, partial [Ignavibacteriaceae bacterium]
EYMNIFKASIFIIFFLFTFSIYSQTTHVVQASDYVFTPANLTIMKGDTVKWIWIEGMHTTTSDTTEGATVWNALLDQSHPSFSYVFNNTGNFSYYCIYHVSFGMKGNITVGPATSVNSKNSIPGGYSLEQNYPNPFNPSTIIEYSLPKQSYVTLTVYNILGKDIMTLVNKQEDAGNYKVEFNSQHAANGKPLTSGLYFYQIEATPVGNQAASYIKTKKMILLK